MRGFGAKSVGSFVPRLTRTAFAKYGFSAATLLTDWATIAGPDLARYTIPERLKWPRAAGLRDEEGGEGRPGATLVLRVDDGKAIDVQYKARQIMERINAYFGYRAVAEIRILQAPVPVQAANARPATPGRAPSPPPAQVLGIADEGLRAAFAQMAAGLANRRLNTTD